MEEFFKEKFKIFIGGFIAGGIPTCIGFLHIPIIGTDLKRLVLEYIFRFFGAIIIALFTGLITVMMKDFYDIKIKPWYHKILGKNKKK
jgi:hypothetical protein